ncbi:MAG: bifunctional adenosylcobinamide kinase/adenosylcobinamide-phosphate guanylyltransferase [Bacteroidota bacterium]
MIHLITGGERSGKTSYAQSLALSLTDKPVYLATAKIWDEDFKERVDRHKSERDENWTNIEEQLEISKVIPENRVVVFDCVTLWLNNYFMKFDNDKIKSLEAAKYEFDKLLTYDGQILIISNEIGMGLHGESKMARGFVELQGWTNQHIAKAADNVTFMVSGLPMKVK